MANQLNAAPTLTAPRSRSGRLAFLVTVKKALLIAAGLDVLCLALLYVLGANRLACINIFSIGIYALAWYLLKHRFTSLAILITCTEVFARAAYGTYIIGLDGGFHYAILLLVPLIFVRLRIRSSLLALSGVWLFFIGIDLSAHQWLPAAPLHALPLLLVRVFNLTTVIVMFALLSFSYMQVVGSAERALQLQAATDPLTGLFNRRHVLDVVEYEVKRRSRATAPLCVLLGDVDHFKACNDALGHVAGDQVLVWVSEAMQASVREGDTVGRWGGEEFLIVLPNTEPGRAMRVAERIRKNVQSRRNIKIITATCPP